MIVKVLILAALIKLLILTEKPMLCAGIYGAVALLFTLFVHGPSLGLIVVGAVAFALAAIYFWLLQRFQDSALFWVIAVLGIAIGFV
jgi:hypothetical protein